MNRGGLIIQSSEVDVPVHSLLSTLSGFLTYVGEVLRGTARYHRRFIDSSSHIRDRISLIPSNCICLLGAHAKATKALKISRFLPAERSTAVRTDATSSGPRFLLLSALTVPPMWLK